MSRVRESKKTLTYRARSSMLRPKLPKQTSAEKSRKQAANRERKMKLANSFNNIREVIWTHAEQMKQEFGKHPASWYFEAIMQRGRADRARRKPNRWNAYLSQEVVKRNEATPTDKSKANLMVNITEIRNVWNAMTPEEQMAATAEAMEELEEKRAVKALAERKVAQSSFQDARHTLETIQEDLMALSSWTGVESLLISIRSSAENYTQPLSFCSTKAILKYFTMVWRTTPLEIACKMEAYLLSGVGGVVSSHADSIVELKKSIVQFISDTLYEAIDNPNIPPPRMNYANFSDAITAKFGVVIIGWPLPDRFCSPGDITSKNELTVLHHAWVSKQTWFRKMSDEEFNTWTLERVERLTHEVQNASSASNTNESVSNMANTNGGTSNSDLSTSASGSGSDMLAGLPSSSSSPPLLQSPAMPPQVPSSASQITFQLVDFGSVTTASGELVPVTKKPRKTRSDKNVKRGPQNRPPPDFRVHFAPQG
ncbi:hypothetical protein BDN71DRAFT_1503253 [Pleurotus eryngii]|uniref:Uncharacterized protein n=1 Tax=Pleurotus eryngii TaxID=5323 RepID=A0A9P6DIN0_PLEER|nr:hypothetical protein BDN71DRAFT_1503253 [Pleurotus eryngii]